MTKLLFDHAPLWAVGGEGSNPLRPIKIFIKKIAVTFRV